MKGFEKYIPSEEVQEKRSLFQSWIAEDNFLLWRSYAKAKRMTIRNLLEFSISAYIEKINPLAESEVPAFEKAMKEERAKLDKKKKPASKKK